MWGLVRPALPLMRDRRTAKTMRRTARRSMRQLDQAALRAAAFFSAWANSASRTQAPSAST